METLDLDASLQCLVDEDEIKYQVKEQLNNTLGSSVEKLGQIQQLVADLTVSRDQLQQTLRFATTEAPDKITRAVKAAEGALEREAVLVQECEQLEDEVKIHMEKIAPLLKSIGPGVRQVRQLERKRLYQEFVTVIQKLSKDMESAVHIGAEGQALVGYGKLLALTTATMHTSCTHLRKYTMQTLIHWNKVFTQTFTREFEGVLKAIKWPFTSGSETVHQTPASPESLQRLCTLTQYLLQLSLPDEVKNEAGDLEAPSTPNSGPPGFICDFTPPLLPIHLLIRPLQVRFEFHFSGNRATNSREHPEWYLTQVLKWISAHHTFLTTRIQPVLDRCDHPHVNAKVEFMRGLVQAVVVKLASDLPHLQYDDDTFSATVQETLNFERELSLTNGYPPSQPSPLIVLTRPPTFLRWIHVERKFAVEVMDEVLSGADAWGEGEGGEAAHCGQQLLLLLQGITDRYKRLPQPGHRLQFLELQLDLIDDFRVRVLQVMKSEKRDPLTSHYPAILNTVHHIAATLRDWADLSFFGEMQYYQECFSKIHDQTKAAVGSQDISASPVAFNKTTSSDDPSAFTLTAEDVTHLPSTLTPTPAPDQLARQDALESLNVNTEAPISSQLAEVSGTVFDDAIRLYEHIEKDMVRTLATYVFIEVRARSQPYRRDKWFHTAGPTTPQAGPVELSPSICPLLEVLARHLHSLKDSLAPRLFMQLWKIVAHDLDKYVYEEVILETRYSDTGAAQFKFDMTRGLFPIFGEFTQKPQNYFRQVKESSILLTLPWPTVVLLRDTIRMCQEDQDAFSLVVSPVKALAEHGVSLLTPPQADTVLNIKIYHHD
ncbi:hypothetical protein Pmani_019414 [Petrolisthes manimaculis]|uniref:RAD50-interacting protein 1 n=1 Tax=Petrolisthes manimaculis TaxID=1843537 RepID=A0AAE1PI81_9EUCA|nr:hypothetical protein Pmani_019414 [Petrolisthes manimaculis]